MALISTRGDDRSGRTSRRRPGCTYAPDTPAWRSAFGSAFPFRIQPREHAHLRSEEPTLSAPQLLFSAYIPSLLWSTIKQHRRVPARLWIYCVFCTWPPVTPALTPFQDAAVSPSRALMRPTRYVYEYYARIQPSRPAFDPRPPCLRRACIEKILAPNPRPRRLHHRRPHKSLYGNENAVAFSF